MAFHRNHIALSGLLVFLAMPAFAQNARSHIAEIEKERAVQEASIDNLRAELTEKTSEIEKIKKENKTRLVSKLVLQKKLREAQSVTKDLESLVKEHAQLTQELRKERSNLLHEIDTQIQTLSAHKNSRQLAELQQLQKLVGEKDQLLLLQQKELLEIPEFNLSSSTNDKDDLVEKMKVVEDLQSNMKQKIAFLKDEISEERSKEFLRNEVSHFIDEENFFGEQSFISNGLNRKDNSKNLAALALKRDSATDTTNPSTTPTSPTNPSITPGNPTTPTSTDPTTSANPTTTGTQATTAAAPPVTSSSTSFQQPQQMFQALLDQVQESIRDTNPKQNAKNKEVAVAKSQPANTFKKNKQGSLEQNLAISEKILNDLNVLHQNLNQKIQELE